jgi:hypothetical protein
VQHLEYAKDESTAIKKHIDGWKSRKKQKTDKKTAPKAAAGTAGSGAAAAATVAPARPSVLPLTSRLQ